MPNFLQRLFRNTKYSMVLITVFQGRIKVYVKVEQIVAVQGQRVCFLARSKQQTLDPFLQKRVGTKQTPNNDPLRHATKGPTLDNQLFLDWIL